MPTDTDLWCRIDNDEASGLVHDLPSEAQTHAATELFKVLGDPTRMRLLSLLRQQPLCVHDLSALLGMHQTAVSHQLKVLRHNRLVRFHKEGRMTVYALDDSHVSWLLDAGLEHVRENQS